MKANMQNEPPPSSPRTPAPIPPSSCEMPPPTPPIQSQGTTLPSSSVRMTIYPRPIGERAQVFSYPPKLGMQRRGSESTSSGASSSSSQQGAQTLCPPNSPLSFAIASSSIANPSIASSPIEPQSHGVPSSVVPITPTTPTRFITRTFLVIPDGIQWNGNGLPSSTHWPSEPQTVVVSLPDSTKWPGVNYPQQFTPRSVEFGVAECFSRLPQYQGTMGEIVTGTFYKRTKKRKGVGVEKAYKLESYVQEAGAVYGKLSANTVVVYLPASRSSTLPVPLQQTRETPPPQLPPVESPTRGFSMESQIPRREIGGRGVTADTCGIGPEGAGLGESSRGSRLDWDGSGEIRGSGSWQNEDEEEYDEEECVRDDMRLQGGPCDMPPSEMPSSSSELIDLTMPSSHRIGSLDEEYFDYLSREWIRLHEAYFAALERRNKKMCDSDVHHRGENC